MVITKSEIAEMLDDRTIEVVVYTSKDDVHGHGSFQLKPVDQDYEELRVRYKLEKPGDCLCVEYEFCDGDWLKVSESVPDGSAPLNVTNL